jgi:GcrA cell cycle regulator
MREALAWVDLTHLEKTRALKPLLAAGLGHRECAVHLSAIYGPITTNTVRGFCHRTGLKPCREAARARLLAREADRRARRLSPVKRLARSEPEQAPEDEFPLADDRAEPCPARARRRGADGRSALQPSADLAGRLPTGEGDAIGLTLFELSDRTCRYPLGGLSAPARLFCGKAVQVGSSYCPDCHARAHERPEERERRGWFRLPGRRPGHAGRGSVRSSRLEGRDRRGPGSGSGTAGEAA